MLNVKFQKGYSYWVDVYNQVLRQQRVSVDEFNLLGGRKSGKSVSVFILFALLLHLPFKVGLFAFRASKDDAKELFNDICETFDAFDVPYRSNSAKLTISWGVNTIRCIGVNSMAKSTAKKSGLARVGNVKYIFKFFEERFEFTPKDYQALQEAVRGMDANIQTITINVCNPWAKSSPYIAYCAKYQEWNLNKLKENGSQVGVYTEIDPETKIKITKLFHYTNWRIIKDVLSVSEINEIRNTWNIDRNRAMTTDYGMPGYEFGAIYTHLLHKIGRPIYTNEPQFFIAGMDYGWSQRDIGGKTACYFGAANTENGVDIYAEYMHDNALQPKSPNQVALEIVDFYINAMEDYCKQMGLYAAPQLKVRVDNMAVGIIQILNNTAQQKRCNHWLQFIKCRKYPIQDRIELTTNLMGGQWLRIAPECKNLFNEFELAHYEETETQKRAKENDHSLNAFEYAIEPVMYKLARELKIPHLVEKYAKENRIW